MFILRQASLKMAILLHTVANWRFIMIIAVVVSRNQDVHICSAMKNIYNSKEVTFEK